MSDAPHKISHSTVSTLHHIHKKLTELNSQIGRGPRQLQAGIKAIETLKASEQQAKDALQQAKIACDRKQLQLKEREQRVADLKAKLNTAASNREFQTFKEQIAADQQANGVLADEILEAMEKIDELGRELKLRTEDLNQREADHASLQSEVDARVSVATAERERVMEELAVAEEQLPDDAVEIYQRLIRSHGEDGLAHVEGQSCGNCGATFAPQVLNRLMLSHFICCPTCGAILYMTADSVSE
ncbi:Putative zinc ribbon domain protein [Rosistilla carotiformis]|uniref:Zinc ribbon domain protein n=1 Tax=Rosistilla carotiformis TaxID=2528017 RepID=A0A518JWZ8_9BACT|nr:phospholipase [Rosistilla carotiformis]QDV70063.1 Putative zinc ribbon domain protein [Rosistilla carotiformis]